MFLLGHSCWSYLISKATGQKLNVNLPLYLALLSGVLPDFDIYFHPYLQHHTYTHSILILGPISILLTIRFKKLGAAFSSGLLSHLLTDSLVGDIPLAYPLSNYRIGLAQFISNVAVVPGLLDTTLETGALLLVIVYVFRNGDYRQFTRPGRDSLRMAVTLASIVTLTLLFAGDNNISLTAFAFSRRALTLISLGHIFQAGALALGTAQGLRAYLASGQAQAKERFAAKRPLYVGLLPTAHLTPLSAGYKLHKSTRALAITHLGLLEAVSYWLVNVVELSQDRLVPHTIRVSSHPLLCRLYDFRVHSQRLLPELHQQYLAYTNPGS